MGTGAETNLVKNTLSFNDLDRENRESSCPRDGNLKGRGLGRREFNSHKSAIGAALVAFLLLANTRK